MSRPTTEDRPLSGAAFHDPSRGFAQSNLSARSHLLTRLLARNWNGPIRANSILTRSPGSPHRPRRQVVQRAENAVLPACHPLQWRMPDGPQAVPDELQAQIFQSSRSPQCEAGRRSCGAPPRTMTLSRFAGSSWMPGSDPQARPWNSSSYAAPATNVEASKNRRLTLHFFWNKGAPKGNRALIARAACRQPGPRQPHLGGRGGSAK